MSETLPLVSVLMPAYNHEKFVERAVRSVFAQTYPTIELIILDDGSKDNTLRVVQQLQKEGATRLAHFSFSTQPNAGSATTFNRLLKKATGKYVLFLASDDELLPECISTQVAFLEGHPDYVINVGDNEFIDAENNRLERAHPKNNFFPLHTSAKHFPTFGAWLQKDRPDVDFLSDQFGSYASLIKGNYLPNGILYRKNALEQTEPLCEKTPLEDWFMNLQMAKQGKFHYTPQILFRYRIHNTNTIKNSEKMMRMTRQTQFYNWYLSKQTPDSVWYQITDNYYFQFVTQKKVGFLGIYFIKRRNNFFSQKAIQIGKRLFIFRSRRLNTWPDYGGKDPYNP